jgi:Zn-dependent membrane protease YugP
MFIGPYDWLAIPGLLLGLYAQFKLTSTYNRYVQVQGESGLTGAQAARAILDDAGLSHVPVEPVEGHLTDHYDPTRRALFLSEENFAGRSLAALGVAAHEAGHALQHKVAYAPLQLRMMLVPATGFASSAVWIIVLGGMLLGSLHIISPALFAKLLFAAVGLYAVVTLFQLITLPVEFDASRRAKEQLVRLGLVSQREEGGVRAVLSAAALTYVAALIASAFELLRLVFLARSADRD